MTERTNSGVEQGDTSRETKGRPTDDALRIRKIRVILGRTQAELATALGISKKTVQSYEQGWRDVPQRVTIQLLVLLALYRRGQLEDVPCWELRKCDPEQRESCPSYTVGRGQFCWFIGHRHCRPESTTEDPILPCIECPVIQRILTHNDIIDHSQNVIERNAM